MAASSRQAGYLRLKKKKAKGKTYKVWWWQRWRPATPADRTNAEWVKASPVELGPTVSNLRTRVLIALGELPSAAVITERYARSLVDHWEELPAWTGYGRKTANGAKLKQESAWWLELPKPTDKDGAVRFRVKKVDRDSWHDYRTKAVRDWIRYVEENSSVVYRNLTVDPIERLARLQWFLDQLQRLQIDAEGYLAKARKQRREGELTKAYFEEYERDVMASIDRRQESMTRLESSWTEWLEEMVAALPRTRREELRPRIVTTAEKMLTNQRRLTGWSNEHWDDGTLHYHY